MPISHFVIDAMPRTGSTSLAALLCCQPQVTCLIEPFHPVRYNGQYNREVKDDGSLRHMMDLIWLRWTGFKHVWQVPGHWPFSCDSPVNEEIVRYAPAVIALERRNLLQRYVSSVISRELLFWIGSRTEFLNRLACINLLDFDPKTAKDAIRQDMAALARRRECLRDHAHVFTLTYEDFFGQDATDTSKRECINSILAFLGAPPLSDKHVNSEAWKTASNEEVAKWNTRETYERIPGIHRLEEEVGSDESGWLFR